MKITADTITDEQIAGLNKTQRTRKRDAMTAVTIRRYAGIALSDGVYPANVVRLARERCAEILNARKEPK